MARPLNRAALAGDVLEIAPRLLGAVLSSTTADGAVAVRLTEVEAYDGASDPGSHAYRGRTARNAVMFGPPGHLYVYFTYGMHFCMNIACGPDGSASAVLLRAGEIVTGAELARTRRGPAVRDRELARGPARMCVALGIDRAANGADLFDPTSPIRLLPADEEPGKVEQGPRVGLREAADRPWRFWLSGEPTVSVYRPHQPKRR
jgi:DNA-3-methyladenine glycosylase